MRGRRTAAVAGSIAWALGFGASAWSEAQAQQPSWRGLLVAPERRCSPYRADEYRYSQSLEDRIVAGLGGVYGPYTGRWFRSTSETDIEHIVARSEAHDSGLCAASGETRRRFAGDLLNLTLAAPSVNRSLKLDRDPAEWLPDRNRCWFAARVIAVRQKYRLTIDRAEAEALDQVLAGCTSTAMVVLPRGGAPAGPVVAEWDDNRNGFVSCAEARAHGIAPVRSDHPAYPFMRDTDGDGVVCESGGGGQAPARVRPPETTARPGCEQPYRNCTALRRDHPRGVASDHCAYRPSMDRDRDGWACER